MAVTCMVCRGETGGASDCGTHPRLLVEAVWGEGAEGARSRLQAAYLKASAQAAGPEGWDPQAWQMAVVRELLPWRATGRGDLAEALRGELRERPNAAEAEVAAMLGLSELREQMGWFRGAEHLRATALRRDLEIKAAGGAEPSEVMFLDPHEEFEHGVEARLDSAELGERLRVHLEQGRAAVALMLHCEIIDADGELFEGRKAAQAAEVAAALGLNELDEVVYLLSDQRYKQAQATLDAAAVLARGAGGANAGAVFGEEA